MGNFDEDEQEQYGGDGFPDLPEPLQNALKELLRKALQREMYARRQEVMEFAQAALLRSRRAIHLLGLWYMGIRATDWRWHGWQPWGQWLLRRRLQHLPSFP